MGPLALPSSAGKRSSRSRRDKSVFATIAYGQISGRGIKSIRRLPKPLYQRLYALSHGMAGLCKDLESHFLSNDLEGCRTVIGRIFRNIGESPGNSQQNSRDSFVLCGGDTLFIRILSSPFANPRETDREGSSRRVSERQGGAAEAGAGAGSGGGGRAGGGARNRRGIFRTESAEGTREGETSRDAGEGEASREETALWMMRNDCLAVLREMCFASASFSEGLSVQRQFLIRLFALMENKITFDYAVALAEEILAVGEETLSLGSVPNFARLVRGLSSRQLSFFCRVLAMVVFEPEDRAPEVSALQKGADPLERAEREAEWAVADSNHDVLLAIPEILPNLVKLLQMDSAGEADLWSPSLSEWQPLLGDLMAGEDETAADWGPEEDDEEHYNEDGEEEEEEVEEEGEEGEVEDEEEEGEVEEGEVEEIDMETEAVDGEETGGEGEGEDEQEEGEEGEGEEGEGEEEEGEMADAVYGFYEDGVEEIAGEERGEEEEGVEGEEGEEGEGEEEEEGGRKGRVRKRAEGGAGEGARGRGAGWEGFGEEGIAGREREVGGRGGRVGGVVLLLVRCILSRDYSAGGGTMLVPAVVAVAVVEGGGRRKRMGEAEAVQGEAQRGAQGEAEETGERKPLELQGGRRAGGTYGEVLACLGGWGGLDRGQQAEGEAQGGREEGEEEKEERVRILDRIAVGVPCLSVVLVLWLLVKGELVRGRNMPVLLMLLYPWQARRRVQRVIEPGGRSPRLRLPPSSSPPPAAPAASLPPCRRPPLCPSDHPHRNLHVPP
ncbi:hypothetical protein CLOP_g2573 [Closterium sp. NIES-67]|nr:hypothetical protein CLOP_g2573 [Closterium sp. NIES-67]